MAVLPTEPLRAPPLVHPFHVVLVEPEIPPNTGNVARLCAATCCPLHLVGKLGFRIDEHTVRRAGLDYWPLVEVHQHSDLPAAELAIAHTKNALSAPSSSNDALSAPGSERLGSRSWLFSGKSTRSYLQVDFRLGDALVFGRESVGLPPALLQEREPWVVAIPTLGAVRSLNLSNSVAVALYEALRRVGALSV
jgi:tRNA (cytidine/uridine-2'-O-)-methyltransferase